MEGANRRSVTFVYGLGVSFGWNVYPLDRYRVLFWTIVSGFFGDYLVDSSGNRIDRIGLVVLQDLRLWGRLLV